MSGIQAVIIILLIFNAVLLCCILAVWLKEGGVFFKKYRIPEVEEEDELRRDPAETRPENSEITEASGGGLDDINVQLSLSQIGPHFIFNSLNTIYYLVEKDPEAAQAAINEFSVYLRGNIDSFGKKEPIPFSEELEHVQHYLTLEKLRYEEELNVVFDIHTRDFLIPALSVQALAENAVRHGVSKKEGGGSVVIQAWEGKDTFSVAVRDDGRGFDPEEEPRDGKTHTGIKNVRKLVSAICNGTLDIMSEKGVGTTAVIRVPKFSPGPE